MDLRVGPKARRLGQALRRGLPVPNGFVVLPDDDLQNLQIFLNELGGQRFAVRSSATVEDRLDRSAAGIFLSLTDVPREGVADAIAQVRASGQGAAALAYVGAAVEVPVFVQPMVSAERLGVLYIDCQHGDGICEERPASAPEWAEVTPHKFDAHEESPLAIFARRLTQLVESAAAYIEYAVLPDGSVQFLQVRPAPPPSQQAPPSWPSAISELTYFLDQEHNPDPLSAAQSGLVEDVANLVTTFDQRVLGGYLYYAPKSAPTETHHNNLAAHYAQSIAPSCEALLQPLELSINAQDGALDPQLLDDPSRCRLELADALFAYRGVYRIYVAELSPSLRAARKRLEALLLAKLGESLTDPRPRHGHAALLAAAAEFPTERLQTLFDLGHAEATAQPQLLRRYLARYGAFASSWDIAAPCDDERADWLISTAQRLSKGPEPRQQQAQAQSSYREALARLLSRLPRESHDEAQTLLVEARTARRLAEEDDALFFRAQRLCRWALLRRGALLFAAGRLPRIEAIFDLPWALHAAHLRDFSATEFAPGLALSTLAENGAAEREAARAVVPPSRIEKGQPIWTQSPSLIGAEVLRGYGVRGAAFGPLRGRARVVKALFPAPSLSDLGPEDILVLPALLPSWAAELWQARALVTDSGGALCHGAILARERGVPAVVGTRSATHLIRDGQPLLVDAERGLVYLLPEPVCGSLPS